MVLFSVVTKLESNLRTYSCSNTHSSREKDYQFKLQGCIY